MLNNVPTCSEDGITAIALGISNAEDFRDEISIKDDPSLMSTHLEQPSQIRTIVDLGVQK